MILVNGVAVVNSAISEYEQQHAALRTQARTLLTQLREMQTLRRANPQIAAAVEATEAGQVVSGGTMPKEAYQLADALFDGLAAFVATDVVPGITYEYAVYRMG